MTQQLLFESGDIRITATVAQFGGTSYQIANIGSVGIAQQRTRRPVTVAIFILGALVLAGSLLIQHFEMTATGTASRSGQLTSAASSSCWAPCSCSWSCPAGDTC